MVFTISLFYLTIFTNAFRFTLTYPGELSIGVIVDAFLDVEESKIEIPDAVKDTIVISGVGDGILMIEFDVDAALFNINW